MKGNGGKEFVFNIAMWLIVISILQVTKTKRICKSSPNGVLYIIFMFELITVRFA